MNRGRSPLVNRIGKTLLFFALLLAPVSFVVAQENGQHPTPPIVPGRDDDKPSPFTPIDEELKAKRAIKFADKEYQENLDRARDLQTLSTAIATAYKEKNHLGPDDIKKLEKIERLAKGIRNAAGGSEDDSKMEKPPTDLSSAVKMLDDLGQSLKTRVEKTPKHVISAAVIDQANVLLEVVRLVRTMPS
jgi:hypothetical protein